MSTISILSQSIDKGLRSQHFCEQTATLCRVTRAFNDHPLPTFVNSIVLRLAETFRDGSNDLRVAIARVLGQCESQLTLAFSSVEIFRRIMTVSHSNDPEARETVLDTLKCLSIMDPENKQAHHFIREALATTHEGEFRAACEAMAQFAKLSSEFAESAAGIVSKIITDSAISSERKVLAAQVIAHMSANIHSVEQVLILSESLITWNPEGKVLDALLDVTTSLCIETKYAIPRQLDLLLTLLKLRIVNEEKQEDATPTSPILSTPDRDYALTVILTQMKRIAHYGTIWNSPQITKLASLELAYATNVNKVHLRLLADIALRLSHNCLPSHFEALSKLVLPLSSLGTLDDISLRVRHVQLTIECLFAAKKAATSFEESTPVFLMVASVIQSDLPDKLSKRLYKSIGDYLCADEFRETTSVAVIITALQNSFFMESVANAEHKLQLFCRMADKLPDYVRPLQAFAKSIVATNERLAMKYPTLIVFLLLGVNLPVDVKEILKLVHSPVLKYFAARTALRNGHWKKVAQPILETISTKRMNVMEHDWINMLWHLSSAQVEEFDIDDIEIAQEHLESAISTLETASQTERYTDCARIPLLFSRCLHRTNDIIGQLMTTSKPFMTSLRAALTPGMYFNPVVAKRMTYALSGLVSEAKAAYEAWSVLCRNAFCADATSRDLFVLESERVGLMILCLDIFLTGRAPDRSSELRQLLNHTTTTTILKKQLEWVIGQIGYLTYEEYPDINNLLSFIAILERLTLAPSYVPRFFFQQRNYVKFKLNITPPGDVQKSVGETTPVRIDGSFSCSEPDAIQSIRVIAAVNYLINAQKNREFVEEVKPNEKNFFHAQFLFTATQTCDVIFRLEFIDSTYHHSWISPESAKMTIEVMPMRRHN